MTETTDIKALREAAALIAHGYKQRWGCETNEDTGFVGVGTFDHDGDLCPFIEVSVSNWSDEDGDDERLAEFLTLANPVAILAILDQLEAERQQREAAEAELAEMRGTQEPDDTMAYMMPNVFASLVNTARDVALEYKNAQCLRDALSRELKGYFTLTRQPKPVVVLPSLNEERFHRYDEWHDITVFDEDVYVPEVIAILEAAGIVVKDGD